MASYSTSQIKSIITQVANELGVPPELALAIAQQESGFDPYSVGDHGTSFGLFQLHEGGELGSHSSSWAYDPYNNARTALSEVARVYHKHPDWSYGQVAAAAQRPANQGAYASAIDRIVGSSGGGTYGTYGRGVSYGPSAEAMFASSSGGSTVLKVGSRGSDVKQLQQALGITADGIYGPQTEKAVKSYQKKNHLTVDGIAGPQTLGSLGLGGGGSNGMPSQSDLAAQYGYSSAFFDTDPSLKKLVNEAVEKNWSQAQFDSHLKNTPWYKKHSDAQRAWAIQQADDPGQTQRQITQREHDIRQEAVALGVSMSTADINKFALESLQNNLSDTEIEQGLAAHLQFKNGVDPIGQAGVTQDQLRNIAHTYGIGMSANTINSWTRNILMGNQTTDNYTQYVQNLAKSAFPGIAKQIEQGMTVQDVAAPYMQQMANTLEIDADGIDFSKDPLIRQAFSYGAAPDTTAGGAHKTGERNATSNPGLMPLWQFDQTVKSDPRWLKTDNARESLMNVTNGILKDWGLSF